MIRQSRHQLGQLAIGLAFAFVCILAMLGLVFNSSLNTRDKMKLQTTTDYATMIAANTQRIALNEIHRNNKAIETEYGALLIALNIPYCGMNIVQGQTLYSVVVAEVNAFLGAQAAVKNEVNDSDGSNPCDSACDRYDNKWKSYYIQIYRALHAEYFSNIKTILEETNPDAFDNALNTFMDPKGLPSGLYFEMQKKLGAGFKTQDVRHLYDTGQLAPTQTAEYGYDIVANSEDPLFEAKLESKQTVHYNFTYTYIPPTQTSPAYCNFFGTPGIPRYVSLPYRVYRSSDYTTQFFTKATYLAPKSLIEKVLNIGVKNPNTSSEEFGHDIGDPNNKELLFSKKFPIQQSVAGAKPYGGQFPQSGFAGWGGTSGEKFVGAKLFGVADRAEIGDQRIDRLDGSLDSTDPQGNTVNSVPFYVEDFLH